MESPGDGNGENKDDEERDFTLRKAIGDPGDERQEQQVRWVSELGRRMPPDENDHREEDGCQEDESRFHQARTVPARPTQMPYGKYQWRDHKNTAGITDPPRQPSSEGR